MKRLPTTLLFLAILVLALAAFTLPANVARAGSAAAEEAVAAEDGGSVSVPGYTETEKTSALKKKEKMKARVAQQVKLESLGYDNEEGSADNENIIDERGSF